MEGQPMNNVMNTMNNCQYLILLYFGNNFLKILVTGVDILTIKVACLMISCSASSLEVCGRTGAHDRASASIKA